MRCVLFVFCVFRNSFVWKWNVREPKIWLLSPLRFWWYLHIATIHSSQHCVFCTCLRIVYTRRFIRLRCFWIWIHSSRSWKKSKETRKRRRKTTKSMSLFTIRSNEKALQYIWLGLSLHSVPKTRIIFLIHNVFKSILFIIQFSWEKRKKAYFFAF